jgi:hypothetical protein
MKLITLLAISLFASMSYANTIGWNNQKVGLKYSLKKKVDFQINENSIQFPKNTTVELIESSELSMIKVHLFKYKILECSKKDVESELELVESTAETTVGVNLVKNCTLEVFVELKDYKTKSLFTARK